MQWINRTLVQATRKSAPPNGYRGICGWFLFKKDEEGTTAIFFFYKYWYLLKSTRQGSVGHTIFSVFGGDKGKGNPATDSAVVQGRESRIRRFVILLCFTRRHVGTYVIWPAP